MKYKRFVYTPVVLILFVKLVRANYVGGIYENGSKAEGDIATWNQSSEHLDRTPTTRDETPWEMRKCIEERQFQITQGDFSQGKKVILNCFKTSLYLNMLKYLGESSHSSVKLFNGLLEFEKVPEKNFRSFGSFEKRKNEYGRMYKKTVEKLVRERDRLNAYRNRTEEEKSAQLSRIEEKSEAFLSEVVENLGNEDVEKAEEENLRKELGDPKLLSLLDALSKNYLLRFRFYPGASARLMRSSNGGFTFDVEIQESGETSAEENSSNESSTREIKDGPQGKDYFDDDDDDDDSSGGNKIKKKGKKDKKKKKKKKVMKQKQKALKKIIPYLLLPMLIQMTLLPFVFKKLFFLAMKALFAGKVALILIGFNLIRNTCIRNEDDYSQKIRVEHYGYRKGEEYGAWINGRSLGEPSMVAAFSEEPFIAQKPVTQ